MKKVAILIDDMSIKGGQQNVSVGLANELTDYYSIYFITWFNLPFAYELKNEIKYYYLMKEKNRIRKSYYKLSANLRNFIIKNNINVLIVVGRYASLITFLSLIGTGCKLIMWEHSSMKGYGFFYSSFKRKIHNFIILFGYRIFANKIVFLTSYDTQKYKTKMFARKEQIVSIYNWVDTEKFKLTDNYNKKSNKIITVGRLDYAKGYEYLIKVAAIVLKKYPLWEWHIYGEGEERYKRKLLELIAAENLEDKVLLKGRNDNINKAYDNYAFFVLTSRYEGLPMVLLEAKAKKLPLVSFDIESGPSEIIRNCVDGFLIKPFDILNMSEKICELIKNHKLRDSFSKNAYGNLAKFSKDDILDKWLNLINGI